MWVESLHLQNIKCFNDLTIHFGEKEKPFRWTTLLGENGCGKSTILQALGLLLNGSKFIDKFNLDFKNWIKNKSKESSLDFILHQGGADTILKTYPNSIINVYHHGYYFDNKSSLLTLNKYSKEFFESLSYAQKTWFACGYGVYRRLEIAPKSENIYTTESQRYTNFITLFNPNESIPTLNLWFFELDYKILKDKDKVAAHQQELIIQALNTILENNAVYDGIDSDKQIYFKMNGQRISINQLSDGYKSILSLVGDIICRLTIAFPYSEDILKEHGVILIDEIDIHLHPTWQYKIAKQLQDLFPNMQFIVATHSPIVAAGAGFEACTYKLWLENGETQCKRIYNLSTKDVDDILTSTAFNLPSKFSQEIEDIVKRYTILHTKENKTEQEKLELEKLIPLVKSLNHSINDDPNSLENRIRAFLDKNI